MSDEIVTGEDEEEAPAKKKLAGKTIILFLVLPAFLIIGGGASAVMMLMSGGKKEPVEVAKVEGYGEDYGDKAKDEGAGKKDDSAKKDDHGKDDGYDKKDDKGKGDYAKKDKKDDKDGPKRETGTLQVGAAGDPSYYIMPDVLVNLSSSEGDRQLFLKLKLTLEAEDPEMFHDIPKLLPRITDQYQMFLRELRVDDLNGSAGGYRLRTELLRRINLAISPAQIDAVLVEELLVQ